MTGGDEKTKRNEAAMVWAAIGGTVLLVLGSVGFVAINSRPTPEGAAIMRKAKPLDVVVEARRALADRLPDKALTALSSNFTLSEIEAHPELSRVFSDTKRALVSEEGQVLAEEAIKMAFLPPVKTGLSRNQMLAQANSEIDEGIPMRALDTIRANTTGTDMYQDPEIRAVVDRASAKADERMKPIKVSAFIERATIYWPERLADTTVEHSMTGAEVAQKEMVFEDVAQFLDTEPAIADDPKVKEAKAKLRRTLQTRQAELFPQIRKKYADLLAAGLWEHDVYVKANGRTLNFTGVRYAANANVAETQNEVATLAELMRFSRVEYRWHDKSDGKYYPLETPGDTAVGYWSGGKFQTVK